MSLPAPSPRPAEEQPFEGDPVAWLGRVRGFERLRRRAGSEPPGRELRPRLWAPGS